MRAGRRFSLAISEGDGISVVAEVDGPNAARRAEADGAEGVLVRSGRAEQLAQIREAVSVPILFSWEGEDADRLSGADACIIDVEYAHVELGDRFELALRVGDEEQLEEALERFDPELFVLAAGDEQGLGRVLDLLSDVPAGKLAIAELRTTSRADVEELERAGVDAVIVRTGSIADLIGEPPPEV